MTVDVTVIAALLLVCIIALMVGWIVAAAAFGGSMLWAMQWRCVSSTSFEPIRWRGLHRGAWELIRSAAGPGIFGRLVARESWRRIPLILLVPIIGFLVPVSLPYVVLLLVPGATAGGEFAEAINRVGHLTGALGVLVAIRIFLNGLRYIAQPGKPRGKVPGLRIPDDLSSRGRDRLAANAFWFRMAHTVELLAAMYPILVLVAVIPDLGTATTPSSAATPSSDAGSMLPPLLGLIVFFLAVMPMLVPAHIAASFLRRRLAGWELSVEICQLLSPPVLEGRADSLEMPEPLRAVADAHRSSLVDIAVLLDRTAGLWDRRQPRGYTPHPVATVLRAVSASIRRHLQSPESCEPTFPLDLRETLRMVLDLLVEPEGTSSLRELASRVQAFDEDGTPTAETFVKPPGAWRWH
ncbi:hypothetical protein [Salinispora fenicalii]|uniref:hypothetical protein n=1 Tax=Salinispora fenicalii TaxID=1137263 RepID=UPI000484AFB1|nr:hypothetical protein [Salinispora fenicalii]